MKTKAALHVIGLCLVLAVFFSCASAPSAPGGAVQRAEGRAAPEVSANPMYYATGSGSSQTEAINSAKMNAVRKAVQDAVGIPTAMAKQDQIEQLFSKSASANTYVINSTAEILDRSGQDGSYTVTLGVRINLEAVSNMLRANDIYGNQILPQGGEVLLSDQQRPSFAAPQEPVKVSDQAGKEGEEVQPEGQTVAAAAPEEELPLDPEKASIVQDIVDNLAYMVYYNEETISNPFLMKTAVGMANKYLAQQGLDYVDLEQIEKIKEDQMAAYEAETGQGVSVIQWIANKLNADIYIEVSLDTESEERGGRYYGSASVSLKNFAASTGTGRGTAFYQTVPPAMSTVSTDDAVNNAVASATYRAMEEALRQARIYTQKELRQGLKYQLVLQNTPDARVMRNFANRMERKVEEIKRVSYSPAETKYEVRLIGEVSDLEDIIYDVSESVDGMEGLFLVYQRGSSITFDTGM